MVNDVFIADKVEEVIKRMFVYFNCHEAQRLFWRFKLVCFLRFLIKSCEVRILKAQEIICQFSIVIL
jgi:hypothetical protein